MALKTRADLKAFFQTGDIPTQGNFEDLIDSFVHMTEGDDNEGQIKNTLHISSSESYISGSAPGTTYFTPENETKSFHNIQPDNMGDNPSDLITSSISPSSGELINLFDGTAQTGSENAVSFGPTGDLTGSIEFSGDTADGALSDYIETNFVLFHNNFGTGAPEPISTNLFSDTGHNDGFLISYWVKPLETGSLGNPMIAIGKSFMPDFYNPSLGNPGNNEHFAFGIHGPNIFFNVGDTIISSSAHGMEIDRWYHWIIRGEGGSGTEGLQAWRNGEEVFSGSYEAPNSLEGVFPIYYGGRNSGSKGVDSALPFGDDTYTDGWACQLSEVAIFNRSKSISDLWDGSGNPVDLSGTFTETSASGLVLYHKLNEADIQEDGTIKDYGPYDFNASIGDGVSSLNWSNDAAGPDNLTIDFYHQGWEEAPTGDDRSVIANGIFVYFKENLSVKQIQISGSNNGAQTFTPLYGDTTDIIVGSGDPHDVPPFGFKDAPFQTDRRHIRFENDVNYDFYRIKFLNWVSSNLEVTELEFVNSSNYFVDGDVIPGSSTVPMAIASSGSIIPGDDNAYDLGAPDKIWRHIYVGSGSINFMSRSFDTDENKFINEKVAQLTISKSGGTKGGEFLQFKGRKGDDHMDVEFRQVQAGKDPLRGHTLNDAAGPTSTDVYGKMQQYMGGGDGQQLITRPEYTAFSPFGRKFVSHILNAQGRGSLTIGLQNFTGDQKGFFRVEKNTSIAGAGTPLFEVSESGQTILYGTDSELTAEGGVSVQGQLSASVGSFTEGNVIIEDGVISQPGTISQSFSIGTLTSPSTTTLTGIGSNCTIAISENVTVTVNNDSLFQIQCPQPDITANSDEGTVTLSDPNVMGGGDVVIYNNNNGNPSIILQNTTIPANQVSYWTVGDVPGTYTSYDGTPLPNNFTGIQIGAQKGVLFDGIFIDGEEIYPAYGTSFTPFNIQLRIEDGAVLHVQNAQPDIVVDTEEDTITLSNGDDQTQTTFSTGQFGTNPQYIPNHLLVPSNQVAIWYGPIYVGRFTLNPFGTDFDADGTGVLNMDEAGQGDNASLRIQNGAQIKIQAF